MEKTTNRKIKSIAFNRKSEIDLLAFAEEKENFSDWVKEKIREDLYGVRIKISDIRNIIKEEIPLNTPPEAKEEKVEKEIEKDTFEEEVDDDMLM